MNYRGKWALLIGILFALLYLVNESFRKLLSWLMFNDLGLGILITFLITIILSYFGIKWLNNESLSNEDLGVIISITAVIIALIGTLLK